MQAPNDYDGGPDRGDKRPLEDAAFAARRGGSLGKSLAVVAIAASARIDDGDGERERLIQVETVLSAARAASAALQLWAAQVLSEYRGSRTTWDVLATTELLGNTLAQLYVSARDASERLSPLLPDIRATLAASHEVRSPDAAAERHVERAPPPPTPGATR